MFSIVWCKNKDFFVFEHYESVNKIFCLSLQANKPTMAEQILQIENVDPKELHGPNDKYLELVKSMFPKLKIIARGDFVKVIGDDDEIDYFTSRYETLMVQLERFGKLTAQTVEDIMMASTDSELQQKMSESDVLVFGRSGVPIKAITANQKRMVTASEQKDLIFAIGPAGTGKTYTAVALAVRALKAKQVRRIILTRPAVEADEHLGFLPGDLKDKLDPYLQPLYIILEQASAFVLESGRLYLC